MTRQTALLYISILTLLIIFGSALSYARADVSNRSIQPSPQSSPIKLSGDTSSLANPSSNPQTVTPIGAPLDGGLNADNGDEFGYAVAIDGDTMVIGARFDELSPLPNSTSTDAGIAYVYRRTLSATSTAWTLDAILSAGQNSRSDDWFGASVAIDGNVIVVGAPRSTPDTILDENAGAVFVFERNGSGIWGQPTVLHADIGLGTDDDPRAQSNDEFGTSVAIDNDIIVVGAIKDEAQLTDTDAGAAYVFARNASNPTQWDIVDILSAELYEDSTGTIQAVGNEFDEFGNSVAIDGTTVIVGAPVDEEGFGIDTDSDIDDTGMAYIFEQITTATTTIWEFQQYITAGAAEDTSDRFGNSVAIDNDTIIVGASRDDSTIERMSGTAYVFNFDGTASEWKLKTILEADDADRNDRFGRQVALDGDIALVGAFRKNVNGLGARTGAAYLFNRDTNGDWLQLGQTITGGSLAKAEDRFGAAVDYDSGTAIIGAFMDSNGPGRAHVFEIGGATVDLQIEKTVVKQNGQTSPSDPKKLSFQITIKNNSTTTATDVEVVDKLSSRVAYTGHSGGEIYDPVSGLWQVGDLDGGAERDLFIFADILPNVSTLPIENTASITDLDQLDTDFSNNTATASIGFADLSLTKTVDNLTPNEGDVVTFTLTITNNSTSTIATDITVMENIPNGLSLSTHTSSPGTSFFTSNSLWLVGDLDPTEFATLEASYTVDAGQGGNTLTNIAEVLSFTEVDPDSTPNNLDPTEDDYASVSITVQQADLSLTKTVNDSNPVEGQTTSYELTVTNAGPNDATNVKVSDALPIDVTFKSSSGDGSYDEINGVWDVGTVSSSTSATLNIEVEVGTGLDGSVVTNSAAITSVDQADPDSTNNQDSVDFTPQAVATPTADLSLSKTVSDPNPNLGDIIEYTLTVSNAGPDDATGVQVQDLLPTEVSFDSSSDPTDYDSSTGTWNVGNIPAASSTILAIRAQVTSGVGTGLIANTAEIVAATEDDPDSTPNDGLPDQDDISNAFFTVNNDADLELLKEVDKDRINNGDTIIYTLTLTNTSNVTTATDIEVIDLLPVGATYVSDSPTQGTYDNSTGLWSVGGLAPQAEVSLEITAQLNFGTLGNTITNVASIQSLNENDPNAANDSDDASVQQNSAPIATSAIADRIVDEDSAPLVITVSNFLDADGDTLNFVVVANSNDSLVNASIPATSNQLTLSFIADQHGTATITIRATDTLGLFEETSFDVTVTPQNDAPVAQNDTVEAPRDGVTDIEDLLTNDSDVDGDSISIIGVTDGANGTVDIINSGRAVRYSHDGSASTSDTFTYTISDSIATSTASVLVTVVDSVDLSLTSTVNDSSVASGQSVVITLTVNNNASSTDATGVQVTNILPEGLVYISNSSSTGTYIPSTGIWDIGTLANATSTSLQITAQVNSSASGAVIEIQAFISSVNQFDLDSSNDSDTATITVSSSVDSTPPPSSSSGGGGRRRGSTPVEPDPVVPVDESLVQTDPPSQTDDGEDGPPIPPEDIEDTPTEQGADVLRQASSKRGAEVIEEVSTQKASDVLSAVERRKAGEILNEVSTEKLTEIITVMPKDKLVERLSEVSTEKLFSIDIEVLLTTLPENVPASQIIREIAPQLPADLDGPSSRQETPARVVYIIERTLRDAWAKMIGSPAPIDEVLGKFTQDLSLVNVIVEDIFELPPRAPKFPPEEVLNAMFTIDLPELNAEDISVAYVTVYVDKDWVEDNDINQWSIRFNRLDEELNTWVPFPSQRVREDEDRIFYSIGIPGFSLFAITGSRDLPEPMFQVTDLQVSTQNAEAGQPVTVTALVRNTSEAQGVFPANIYINDTIEDSEALVVEANSDRQVSFTVTKEAGNYTARIERLRVQFQVTEPILPESTATPTQTPLPQTPTPSPTSVPTATPSPTPSPTATATPSPTPTSSPTPTAAALAIAAPAPTATSVPPSPTPTPSVELAAAPVAPDNNDNRMMIVAIVLGIGVLGAAGVVGFMGFNTRRNGTP